jgi:NADP-dependent 3-hydroxy acid dehydrogenase YdfG
MPPWRHAVVKIMNNNIEGKVVVITGASSGLGEAAARLLSAQGASVVLGARRVDRLRSLADELTGSGGKALPVTTDVTYCDQVKRLVEAAVQTYGRIDVMINTTPGRCRSRHLSASRSMNGTG